MGRIGRPIVVVALVLVGLLSVYAFYTITSIPGPVTSPVPTRFSVNGKTYTFTYIATTEQEREAGLMGKAVTNSTTMLFAFPSSAEWAFYMYKTNTSLDMIWVNASADLGSVVFVQLGAAPCLSLISQQCPLYTPNAPANYVIEAKAGFATTNGIVTGTQIQFS